jgi:hypothetical protein
MLDTKMSIIVVLCAVGGLAAGHAQSQDAGGGADGLGLVVPGVETIPTVIDEKYDFAELSEISSVEPFGASVTSVDVGSMSNFRRAYFLDERAFVLQLPGSGRYYLGILRSASSFTGRCARRPEALSRAGGTYILLCGNKGMPVARFYLVDDSEQLSAITARLQQ